MNQSDPLFWLQTGPGLPPITDTLWLTCSDRFFPHAMFRWLCSRGVPRSKKGRRQLRLFAYASCTLITYLLDPKHRNMMAAVEQGIEGGWKQEEVDKWMPRAVNTGEQVGYTRRAAAGAVQALARRSTVDCVQLVMRKVVDAYARNDTTPGAIDHQRDAVAEAYFCALFRDIFGNPFHPIELLTASKNSTVGNLAQAIYADRAFDLLPILADALEDAGCHNTEILAHCRGPGPHVRGCWVVDLILSKDR